MKEKVMIKNKTIFYSWFWLISLTIASVFVGSLLNHNVDSHSLFIVLVLFIVFLKGQQIIDIFMELKYAPSRWRWLLMSYVILIPSIIAAIYLF